VTAERHRPIGRHRHDRGDGMIRAGRRQPAPTVEGEVTFSMMTKHGRRRPVRGGPPPWSVRSWLDPLVACPAGRTGLDEYPASRGWPSYVCNGSRNAVCLLSWAGVGRSRRRTG
jgi:hypothetical protein